MEKQAGYSLNSEEITVEGFYMKVSALRSANKGPFTLCPDGVDSKFCPIVPILLYIKTL